MNRGFRRPGVGISYGIDMTWFFGKGHAILHG